MANEGHDHRAAQDGLIEYRRDSRGTYDTGQQIKRGTLAGPPQQYVDHAGQATTVYEYVEGGADVYTGTDQPNYWAKERIVAEAEGLAHSTDWKSTSARFRALRSEWKAVGPIDRRINDQLWARLNAAQDSFRRAQDAHFEGQKQAQLAAAAEKSRIVGRAESLVHSSDPRAAGDEMKRLLDEWKRAGRCERSEEDRLWARFDSARKRMFERRQRDWADNKAAKERLLGQAQSLANGTDLKSATDSMRTLSDEWKRIGPCGRADDERLWAAFNAARAKLNERKSQQFEQRQREWASNRALKEHIASQAESLASSADLKSAGDQMRTLADQWKRTGPCEKADNERLWVRFSAAKTKLRDRRQRDFEDRKAEREKKQQEWQARQAERERKQAEYEARQAERARKQQEWQARQAERARKQADYEARQAARRSMPTGRSGKQARSMFDPFGPRSGKQAKGPFGF